MCILAIDTVSAKPAVALTKDGKITCQELPSGRRQSAELLPNVRQIMADQNVEMSDLSELYILTGPGSFTGVRVGLSFLKGIAIALNIPLYGANHFDILKPYMEPDRTTAVILESGRDEKFIKLGDDLMNISLDDFKNKNINFDAFISDFDIKNIFDGVKKQEIDGFSVELLIKYLNNKENKGLQSEQVAPYYLREADTTTPKAVTARS